MANIVFVDTETTGLDPHTHELWEIAIVEQDGTEHVFTSEPTPQAVQDMPKQASDINQYFERTQAPDWEWDLSQYVMKGNPFRDVHDLLDGSIMVGSNPQFDLDFITQWFKYHQANHNFAAPQPHYRLIDIPTLALGYVLGNGAANATDIAFPFKSTDITDLAGVPFQNPTLRHTALADAHWCRDAWQHIVG